jgi:UDP-N-acetylglucosamine diphosphorylase/glucosamine-1-phosphate N-acetyltransferase
MAGIILDDHPYSLSLYPFAEMRSVADIRIGILTIREKWQLATGQTIRTSAEEGISLLSKVHNLVPANVVASNQWMQDFSNGHVTLESIIDPAEIRMLNYPWDIFAYNDWAIRQDFEALTRNRASAPIPAGVLTVNPADIFLEEGADLQLCALNAATGPIYIGRNSVIMEGSTIRGPFALCENAVVKMGTRVYGATTVGPNSMIGGEIKNSVIFGNSNKGHDGYLGDSVLAEWCNLGAGTTNSNLKNSAAEVKVWNQAEQKYLPAGSKCGLLMGDYSRAAINTSFNTGTVVGICANVFTTGFPPKFINSFSWGPEVHGNYSFEKALEHIANWKKMKKQVLSKNEIQRLKHIFETLTGV